jgi:hypothetical protein
MIYLFLTGVHLMEIHFKSRHVSHRRASHGHVSYGRASQGVYLINIVSGLHRHREISPVLAYKGVAGAGRPPFLLA